MNKPIINLDVIDTESASQAVQIISRLAEENGVNWALVGGLAMIFVWKRQADQRYRCDRR